MSPPDSLTRALLEESAWLQRLARRLVGEPGRAEDAAQDALLVSLARPPAGGDGLATKGRPASVGDDGQRPATTQPRPYN